MKKYFFEKFGRKRIYKEKEYFCFKKTLIYIESQHSQIIEIIEIIEKMYIYKYIYFIYIYI